MSGITERDEMLECLWQLKERGCSTVPALQGSLGDRYQGEDLARLAGDGLVNLSGEDILLTTEGSAHAQRLIRAHRIGERLIHDVMGRAFETGACELEHVLNTEIVDAICTLLGHPRECPHGFPIPEGECCRLSARYVRQTIVPLSQLRVGQSARVAYVYSRSDQQLHRLTSLQIRPGTVIKLHQVYPSFVIAVDGASIALDSEVAGNINVWVEGEEAAERAETEAARAGRERPNFIRPLWRWRFGPRDRR